VYSGGPLEELDYSEGSTWTMHVEWRLHVSEERLKRGFGEVFAIEVVDLCGLTPRDQRRLPIVLVNGVAACVGDIDADAIAAEVGKVVGKSDQAFRPDR
jgi:hypothetical protein